MSLLSLSHAVDYQISVMGWLGQKTEGAGGDPVDDLKKVDPKIVQCIYGKEDDDEVACPDLKGYRRRRHRRSPATIISTRTTSF
jgi:type IV secretory pathway VirJ component